MKKNNINKKDYKEEFIEFITENKLTNVFIKENDFLNKYNTNLFVYMRVSTEKQEFGRQIVELHEYAERKGIKIFIDNIYCDKYTGKRLNRNEYNKLRNLIKSNDYLVISEVSRLGRNWDEIKDEWKRLRDTNINKLIIDYDMLSDTLPFENDIDMTLDRKFVQELIFNAILYVACKKVEEVSRSTISGLKTAKMEGKILGHPRTTKASKENFVRTLELMINNDIGQIKATLKSGFPKDTFTRDIKKCYEKYNSKDYKYILTNVKKENIWPL